MRGILRIKGSSLKTGFGNKKFTKTFKSLGMIMMTIVDQSPLKSYTGEPQIVSV